MSNLFFHNIVTLKIIKKMIIKSIIMDIYQNNSGKKLLIIVYYLLFLIHNIYFFTNCQKINHLLSCKITNTYLRIIFNSKCAITAFYYKKYQLDRLNLWIYRSQNITAIPTMSIMNPIIKKNIPAPLSFRPMIETLFWV